MEKQEVSNKFDGEEVGQVKMSKVEKFFNSQREKFNARFDGEVKSLFEKLNLYTTTSNAKLDNFITSANAQIKKSDEKFSGLYSFLVKQFLSSLEDRVYTLELQSQTTIQFLVDKLYENEVALSKLTNTAVLVKEEFNKKLLADFTQKMIDLDKATKEAAEKESKNEVPQEVVGHAVQEETATSSQEVQ